MDKDGNIKGVVLASAASSASGSIWVAVPFDKMKFVNEPFAYTGRLGRAECECARYPAGAIDNHRRGDHEHRTWPRRQPQGPIRGIPITPYTARPRTS